jgi:hypothetical protein
MIRTLTITSIFIISSSVVFGADDIEKCLNFTDDDLRLACYDEKAGFEVSDNSVEDASSDPYEEFKGWIFSENTDAFSGKDTSGVYLAADLLAESYGDDEPVGIVIRCDGEGGSDLFVVSGGYLNSDSVRVRYKFGDDEPVSEIWDASTDGKIAFLPSGYKDFLSGIISEKNFIFEVEDYNGSKAMATFNGTDKGIEKRNFVLNGCK